MHTIIQFYFLFFEIYFFLKIKTGRNNKCHWKERGAGFKKYCSAIENKKHNYTLNKNTQRLKKNAQKKNKNFVVKYFVTHKINLC